MPMDLVETKLHPPQARTGSVHRPRLSELLATVATSKVALVSAPPGFGKSTLVAEWIAARAPTEPAAWLSLDPRDDDPVVFWRYVVAALRTVVPATGGDAVAALQSSEPQIERALRSLLNDLAALPHGVVLVLDDFHVIERLDIHEAVGRMSYANERSIVERAAAVIADLQRGGLEEAGA